MMNSDLTGQQLGNYRLVSLIGRGSFASVYFGENIHVKGMKVAVKVIHANLPDKDRATFYKEAQVLALLKHPHIVPILDFGVEQGIPYIIAEYAPHGVLRQHMSKAAPERIVPFIKQIADGLYYAHQKKFVHRDIKPDNILYKAEDHILISDFGLAVIAWDSLRTSLDKSLSAGVGTPLYMAPEQWKSKPVPASDQYSLAVIVYQWLCGETPFRGNALPQLMFQHERQLPAPLCEKVPHLPKEIDRVVLKALEKDPKKRFATILEFAEAFSKACPQPVSLGKTVLMSPPPSPSPAPPPQQPDPNPPAAAPAAQNSAGSAPSVPSSTGSGSSLQSISRRGMLVGLGLFLTTAAAYLTIKAVTSPVVVDPTRPTPTPTTPTASASPTPTEVPRGGTAYKLPHDGSIYRVAWSPPDGKYLATCAANTVYVWDVTKETAHALFTGHTATVTDVTWSLDGSRIASSGGAGDNTVWIWDPLLGDATSHDSKVKKISLPDAMNSVQAIAWSADGQYLAIGGGWKGVDYNIYIYDIGTGKPIRTLSGHKGTINSLAWLYYNSGDNDQYLASASDDHTARIWKLSTGKSWPLVGHQDSVYALAWSPDGQYLATGAAGFKDQTVQVWKWKEKPRTSIYTHNSHTKPVYAVAWSPDSAYIASASEDETVQVYTAQSDNRLDTYIENRGPVHAAAWQPQGALVASGDSRTDRDKRYYVRVWQALDT